MSELLVRAYRFPHSPKGDTMMNNDVRNGSYEAAEPACDICHRGTSGAPCADELPLFHHSTNKAPFAFWQAWLLPRGQPPEGRAPDYQCRRLSPLHGGRSGMLPPEPAPCPQAPLPATSKPRPSSPMPAPTFALCPGKNHFLSPRRPCMSQ